MIEREKQHVVFADKQKAAAKTLKQIQFVKFFLIQGCFKHDATEYTFLNGIFVVLYLFISPPARNHTRPIVAIKLPRN